MSKEDLIKKQGARKMSDPLEWAKIKAVHFDDVPDDEAVKRYRQQVKIKKNYAK